MAIPSPLGRRWTVTALLGLTVVTGLVDAVSYLRLGHVFVAWPPPLRRLSQSSSVPLRTVPV
jgi:hypothetical protein